MPETIGFDFKKNVRELIRSELRPLLYEQGFTLNKPTAYIRERGELLQEFYFKVEVDRLRPWVSYRPVFDTRSIVTFGTDNTYIQDCLNPYKGYGWVTLSDRYCNDAERTYENYREKFLPRFEALKSSITNAFLPELKKMHSLDQLIAAYESDELLFAKRIQSYFGAGLYFKFITGVRYSRGMERLNLVMKEMTEWGFCNLPKPVREYLQELEGKRFTDHEADELFEGYCNKIREANKLPLIDRDMKDGCKMPRQRECGISL